MKKHIRSTLTALIFVLVLIVKAQQSNVDLNQWPEISNNTASSMIEKYGEPQQQIEQMFIRNDLEPFKYIIVYRDEVQHNFPMPHRHSKQVINYDVQ